MKKALIIFCALFALVACNIEAIDENPIQVDDQEIRVKFNISRSDIDAETKAMVKSGWADGDVIFAFIKDVTDSPQYLELRYNNGSWIATPKNGLVIPSTGRLAAVYLPYGSNYTVSEGDAGTSSSGASYETYNFKNADGENYSGHFYQSYPNWLWFSFSDNTLSSSDNLTLKPATQIVNEKDKLVHFAITGGFDPTLSYYITQEYMRPLVLRDVRTSGVVDILPVSHSFWVMGTGIPGYYDSVNGILSFSGVLDGRAVGETVEYSFLIHDSNGNVYFRNVGDRKIEKNTYVSLGSLSDWGEPITKSSHYFTVAPNKVVAFAPGNLQYQASTNTWRFAEHQYDFVGDLVGDVEYGNVYVGEVKSKNSERGSDYEGWIDLFAWGTSGDNHGAVYYRPWENGQGSTDYQYCYAYGNEDYNLNDQSGLADWGKKNAIYNPKTNSKDAAGTWRVPSGGSGNYRREWEYLLNNRHCVTSGLPDGEGSNSVCYTLARVNGVPGVILFPDFYTQPSGVRVTGTPIYNAYPSKVDGNPNAGYNNFVVAAADDWGKMETAGAVFLPAAGNRKGENFGGDDAERVTGYYWCSNFNASSSPSKSKAFRFYFTDHGITGSDSGFRSFGYSVRLVHDLN